MNTYFPIQPSDISYSQIYSPPVSVEQTHDSNMNLSPDMTFLVLFFSLVFGMIWYKKHRMHHFTVEQQRAMLERMWQLHSSK